MKIFLLATSIAATSLFGATPTVDNDAHCFARGPKLRQGAGTKLFVHSRINFRMKKKDGGLATMTFLGHLETSYENYDKKKWYVGDVYYGHFQGKDVVSKKSPRARKWKDSEYVRFKKFNANITTTRDGGGIWGYLVISRKYFDQNVKTWDAHYVFQSGDHMGGSVDYICTRN